MTAPVLVLTLPVDPFIGAEFILPNLERFVVDAIDGRTATLRRLDDPSDVFTIDFRVAIPVTLDDTRPDEATVDLSLAVPRSRSVTLAVADVTVSDLRSRR